MTTTQPERAAEVAQPLAGKVAIVTGAAKGLGAAISASLVEQGACLALSGRDVQALEAHETKLRALYSGCESLVTPCDVLDQDSVRRMVERTVEYFGGIDILVNTAGGTGPIETPTYKYPLDGFREVLELNVVGTFLPCREAIPYMIKRRNGRIVNIAGTRTLALELGEYGITVNTVCPNVTHGDRMTRIVREKAERLNLDPEEVYQDFASQTALGRFIDDVDVAAAVTFLISEGARNITGHDIVVDAGWDV
jgi:3-oxoacyl-[acyl-carrier protein] reductase